MWDETCTKDIRRGLLTWFAEHKRVLPWRGQRTLYGVWIAEIMLQQTTVATVIPYYERFMARFPDVESLAHAELTSVMDIWSGLGYYSRAKRLHEAAQLVVTQRHGKLPQSCEQWRKLPGIGAYTSGSIASIGLGQCVPAVDANAKRVFSRWCCAEPKQRADFHGKQLADFAEKMVSPDSPAAWNEAVMELGALVCRARAPRCQQCPVLEWCQAGKAGSAAKNISPAQHKKPQSVVLAQLVLLIGDRVMLVPAGSPPLSDYNYDDTIIRDEFSKLHQGLWGLPSTPWYSADIDFQYQPRDLWRSCLTGMREGDSGLEIQEVGHCQHSITRYRLFVHVHWLRLAKGPFRESTQDLIWDPQKHTRERENGELSLFKLPLVDIPLSSLAAKVLAVALAARS